MSSAKLRATANTSDGAFSAPGFRVSTRALARRQARLRLAKITIIRNP